MIAHRFALRLALFAGLCAVPAAAQLGIYGKFDFNRLTDSNNGSTQSLTGGGVGVYDDFVHAGPIALGLDVRGDLVSGDQYKYRSLLAGVRLAAKVPFIHVRPYVEPVAGIGGGSTAGTSGDTYDNKLVYGAVGGVDVTIFPHLDWRVVEGGYTRQNSNIMVSTGLVIRL